MTHAEAQALATRVRRETGLDGVVADDAEGGYRVDIALPPIADEINALASVDDPNDWEWVRDRFVLPRLSTDPS